MVFPQFPCFVLDQFFADPANTPITPMGHQLVTLCRSVCAEESAQIPDPILENEYCSDSSTYVPLFTLIKNFVVRRIVSFFLTLTVYFVAHRNSQRFETFEASPTGTFTLFSRVLDTSNTSGDEADVSEPRRRVRSKRTYEMRKVWGANEVGHLSLTGPTDFAPKPSHFEGYLCCKDDLVLTHNLHQILRHFQGSKHFPATNG